MDGCQRAFRRNAENGAITAGSAAGSRPVKEPIASLDQRGVRVGSIRQADGEAVQGGQRTGHGDFENCADVVRPALIGCPIEITIGGLDRPRIGGGALSRLETM